MILKYKLKSGKKWRDYSEKNRLKYPISKSDFRLLSGDKTKSLLIKEFLEKL